jgi:hypothetical protein
MESSTLLNLKNRGLLCIPSAEVVKVVKVVNSLLDHSMRRPNCLVHKNLVKKISTRSLFIMNSQYSIVFSKLVKHCLIASNHKIIMICKLLKDLKLLFSTTFVKKRSLTCIYVRSHLKLFKNK